MENLDYDKVRDDFVGWIIIRSLTLGEKNADEIYKAPGFKSSNLQIEFKINGVELPFAETVKSIEKQLDDLIHKEALKIVDGKFVDLENKLTDFQETIGKVSKKFRKKMETEFGLPLTDFD